jgi:hypothetical protein
MLLLTSLMFLACPLPPEENSSNSAVNSPVRNKSNNSNQGSGAQGNGGDKGGGNAQIGPGGGRQFTGSNQGQGGAAKANQAGQPGQGGAPGGVLMDLSQMTPQKSQEEIQAGEALLVSGEVKGECDGAIRVDAIDTTVLGAPQEGEGVPGPISAVDLEEVGPFKLYVPKGATIQLAALCDADRDSKITESIDMLSMGSRIGEVLKEVSGVELLLEKIKPPGEGGPEEPEAGGPGAGGPGAGGPGAETPKTE